MNRFESARSTRNWGGPSNVRISRLPTCPAVRVEEHLARESGRRWSGCRRRRRARDRVDDLRVDPVDVAVGRLEDAHQLLDLGGRHRAERRVAARSGRRSSTAPARLNVPRPE